MLAWSERHDVLLAFLALLFATCFDGVTIALPAERTESPEPGRSVVRLTVPPEAGLTYPFDELFAFGAGRPKRTGVEVTRLEEGEDMAKITASTL